MGLSEDCIEKLTGVALAGGLAGTLAYAGVPALAPGLTELILGGGALAARLSRERQASFTAFQKTLAKQLKKGISIEIERIHNGDPSKRADLDQALEEINTHLPKLAFTAQEIAQSGFDVETILDRVSDLLPENATLRQSEIGRTLLRQLIELSYHHVLTSDKHAATLASFSFKEIIGSLASIKASQENIEGKIDDGEKEAERRHAEQMAANAELLAAIAREKGVDPAHLKPLFEAVGHDPVVDPRHYETAIRAAVESLLARASDPVQPSNDGAAVDEAIRLARKKLKELDTEGAVAALEEARQSPLIQTIRLLREEIAIHETAYQWESALEKRAMVATLDKDDYVVIGQAGDIASRLGLREKARQSHQMAGAICERLLLSDPDNTLWQRGLSVSFVKIGDLLMAEGQRTDALGQYQSARAIAERLAAKDPDNTKWQRDLSVSFNKIGDLLMAEGQRTEALERYQSGLAIAERLAAKDPDNTEWQRDLIVSHVKLAELGTPVEAAGYYEKALAIARALATDGRLAPVDAWMIADLEHRLADAKRKT